MIKVDFKDQTVGIDFVDRDYSTIKKNVIFDIDVIGELSDVSNVDDFVAEMNLGEYDESVEGMKYLFDFNKTGGCIISLGKAKDVNYSRIEFMKKKRVRFCQDSKGEVYVYYSVLY